jgi:hypothetical protein
MACASSRLVTLESTVAFPYSFQSSLGSGRGVRVRVCEIPGQAWEKLEGSFQGPRISLSYVFRQVTRAASTRRGAGI